MPKRKDPTVDSEDEGSSGSDVDIVNVDFEFFAPKPIDYLALKRLLNQLFQSDAQSFQIHDLADLILSQPLLGSTVKGDGEESDPYAFLTVLNLNVHKASMLNAKDHPSIKALVSYLLTKSTGTPSAHTTLQQLIGTDALGSSHHVGLILGERFVNMPVEVIPPMYRMLADEIEWANEDDEPYNFSHYVILSRLYRLSSADVASLNEEADAEAMSAASPKPKKKKKRKSVKSTEDEESFKPGTFSFHLEDDVICKVSTLTLDYDFSNRQPRGEDGGESLGLEMAGRLMVVPAEKLKDLVALMAEEYPLPS
ncbi:Mss4p nuclear export [Tulasnella sp. UAMH 9824]|nr:Mss4p nuclear export [Tulasnella sp. UAMH 9824]